MTMDNPELHLKVLGFANVEVRDPDAIMKSLRRTLENPEIQVVRADRVAGNEHLMLAASNVARATKHGRRRSRSLAMEMLLYVSAQPQIVRAIERLGVNSRTKDIAVIVFPDPSKPFDERRIETACISILGGTRDDSVIELTPKAKTKGLCKAFGITPKELEAARLDGETFESTVKRLVVERSALLSIA